MRPIKLFLIVDEEIRSTQNCSLDVIWPDVDRSMTKSLAPLKQMISDRRS
jgi:hypothetical protein